MFVPVCREITNETSAVSPELSSLWQRAVKSNCRSAKTQLFYKWMEAGKDFGRWLVCVLRKFLCLPRCDNLHIQFCKNGCASRLQVHQERSREDLTRGHHAMGTCTA